MPAPPPTAARGRCPSARAGLRRRRAASVAAALVYALAATSCFSDPGPPSDTTLSSTSGDGTTAATSSETGTTCGSGGCETSATTTGEGEGCEPAPEDACLVPSEYPSIQEALDSPFCDVIWLAPLVYSENVVVNDDVTIAATCPGTATIDGGAQGSAITIEFGDVLLRNLVITNGLAESGGGVRSNSSDSVTLERVRVSGNTARFGGGVYHQYGVLVIDDSEITGNTATIAEEDINELGANTASGGGLYAYVGSVELRGGSSINSNTVTSGAPQLELRGGGLFAEGTMIVIHDDAEVDGNTVEIEGLDGSVGRGGGLALFKVPALNIESARVTNNEVLATGDDGLVLEGGGLWSLQSELSLQSAEVSGNRVEITDALLGTRVASGGGLLLGGGDVFMSRLTMTESSLTSNLAISPGDASGGGIAAVTGVADQELRIFLIASTLEGNRAEAEAFATGGGIFASATANASTVVIAARNSTLSGNRAEGVLVGLSSAEGGAVFLEAPGTDGSTTLQLSSVTIASNTSDSRGGGLRTSGSGVTATLRNTLLSGNLADDGPDCSGTVVSDDNNLIADDTGCTAAFDISDKLGVDPSLAPINNNGGATRTHALMAGSAAVDAGALTDCSDETGAPLATDQRGLPRESGGRCDIGAYERQ